MAHAKSLLYHLKNSLFKKSSSVEGERKRQAFVVIADPEGNNIQYLDVISIKKKEKIEQVNGAADSYHQVYEITCPKKRESIIGEAIRDDSCSESQRSPPNMIGNQLRKVKKKKNKKQYEVQLEEHVEERSVSSEDIGSEPFDCSNNEIRAAETHTFNRSQLSIPCSKETVCQPIQAEEISDNSSGTTSDDSSNSEGCSIVEPPVAINKFTIKKEKVAKKTSQLESLPINTRQNKKVIKNHVRKKTFITTSSTDQKQNRASTSRESQLNDDLISVDDEDDETVMFPSEAHSSNFPTHCEDNILSSDYSESVCKKNTSSKRKKKKSKKKTYEVCPSLSYSKSSVTNIVILDDDNGASPNARNSDCARLKSKDAQNRYARRDVYENRVAMSNRESTSNTKYETHLDSSDALSDNSEAIKTCKTKVSQYGYDRKSSLKYTKSNDLQNEKRSEKKAKKHKKHKFYHRNSDSDVAPVENMCNSKELNPLVKTLEGCQESCTNVANKAKRRKTDRNLKERISEKMSHDVTVLGCNNISKKKIIQNSDKDVPSIDLSSSESCEEVDDADREIFRSKKQFFKKQKNTMLHKSRVNEPSCHTINESDDDDEMTVLYNSFDGGNSLNQTDDSVCDVEDSDDEADGDTNEINDSM